MLIQVSKWDIEYGVRHDCEDCPIAMAVGCFLEDGLRCEVGPDAISIMGPMDEELFVIGLPKVAREFIERFDNESEVSPIEFDLDLPDSVLSDEFRLGKEPSSVESSHWTLYDDGDDF